jgi:hypothetical protein
MPTPTPAPAPSPTTVQWFNPAGGATISGTTTLLFRGTSMVNVEVFRDGKFVTRATVSNAGQMAMATLDTSTLPKGSVTLTAHAWNSAAGKPFTSDGDAGSRSFVVGGTAAPVQSTAAPVQGDTHPAGYTLVLADEFDGGTLDRSRWCTRYVYGGGSALQVPDAACQKNGDGTLDFLNDEQQRYVDRNRLGEIMHKLGGGVLSLRGTRTRTDDSYATYEAAMIRSKQTFRPTQTRSYYMTTRVRLPSVIGTWPAFWLNPDRLPDGSTRWPPEIDILEAPLNGVEDRVEMLHQGTIIRGMQTASGKTEYTYSDPKFDRRFGNYLAPSSLRDRWIEVSAEWTFTSVCFFVDGLKTACQSFRWVENSGATAAPAHVLLNLAIGGPNWAGRHGIDASRFPTSADVDFVRIYAKE